MKNKTNSIQAMLIYTTHKGKTALKAQSAPCISNVLTKYFYNRNHIEQIVENVNQLKITEPNLQLGNMTVIWGLLNVRISQILSRRRWQSKQTLLSGR